MGEMDEQHQQVGYVALVLEVVLGGPEASYPSLSIVVTMASVLVNTPASSSSEKLRSLTGVPARPMVHVQVAGNRLPNLVIMLIPRLTGVCMCGQLSNVNQQTPLPQG